MSWPEVFGLLFFLLPVSAIVTGTVGIIIGIEPVSVLGFATIGVGSVLSWAKTGGEGDGVGGTIAGVWSGSWVTAVVKFRHKL